MDNLFSRRDAMKGIGMATMALGVSSISGSAIGSEKKSPHGSVKHGSGKSGECMLPPLPYSYDALEPFIDKQTLTIHHDKHHAGYVKKFNKAMKELEKTRTSGDLGLIKHWSREFAFNGSGHVLHSLYWGNMSPNGGNPKGELLKAINKSFGSYELFKKQFIAATGAVEASGWGILGYEPYRGYLVVLQAEKHQDLTIWGTIPLMVCDVWEHAYYLSYQNKRKDYVKNFFKIINWDEVGKRYKKTAQVEGYR